MIDPLSVLVGVAGRTEPDDSQGVRIVGMVADDSSSVTAACTVISVFYPPLL
jgi:hypothetical protein